SGGETSALLTKIPQRTTPLSLAQHMSRLQSQRQELRVTPRSGGYLSRLLCMTEYLARRILAAVTRIPTTLAVIAFGLAAIAVSAQTPPQSPAISVSTRLVQVGVIVRDKSG